MKTHNMKIQNIKQRNHPMMTLFLNLIYYNVLICLLL